MEKKEKGGAVLKANEKSAKRRQEKCFLINEDNWGCWFCGILRNYEILRNYKIIQKYKKELMNCKVVNYKIQSTKTKNLRFEKFEIKVYFKI